MREKKGEIPEHAKKILTFIRKRRRQDRKNDVKIVQGFISHTRL